MKVDGEKLQPCLVLSTVFHVVLFAVALFSPSLFPVRGDTFGSVTGGAGGIDVKIVSSISGIPLPSPTVVQENAAANESAGFYRTEAATPAVPENAEPIPETEAPVKTTPSRPERATAARSAKNEPPSSPNNTVPFGQGGRPAMSYGQFLTGAGSGGIQFGDGTFGDRYGWYVDSMTRRISQNWLKSLVDDRVRTAPRVYLNFDIQRDGTIENVDVVQSSGIPSLDRSALRAIMAANPLPSLPADYRGSRVTVNFYFEFSR